VIAVFEMTVTVRAGKTWMPNFGYINTWNKRSAKATEGLRERTEHLDIFLFFTHYSMVFYFRCSVYWWKGVSDFCVLKYY